MLFVTTGYGETPLAVKRLEVAYLANVRGDPWALRGGRAVDGVAEVRGEGKEADDGGGNWSGQRNEWRS